MGKATCQGGDLETVKGMTKASSHKKEESVKSQEKLS